MHGWTGVGQHMFSVHCITSFSVGVCVCARPSGCVCVCGCVHVCVCVCACKVVLLTKPKSARKFGISQSVVTLNSRHSRLKEIWLHTPLLGTGG